MEEDLNGDEDYEVPKKKKKKKKKKSKKDIPRRRDCDSSRRKPACEETRELYRNVVCGQGRLEVTMRSARFDADRDCGVTVRRAAQFMALAGVKRDQVQRQVLCGVPLAWTPINDEDEKDELDRAGKGRPLRPVTRLEEGADAEFLQQYQVFATHCKYLRA